MTPAPMARPKVVVTRARSDAPAWVNGLQALGCEAFAVPWLDLQDLPAANLVDGERALLRARAVMVVSARAAQVFARTDVCWGEVLRGAWAQGLGPRLWAPGPGTRKALEAAGVMPDCIDSPPLESDQFDSEHLWPAVRGQLRRGDHVVFLRGEGASVAGPGRDFLWQRCRDAGALPEALMVYRRALPQWTVQECAEFARLAQDPSVYWLASSSLALQQLPALSAPGAVPWWQGARVVATHGRIAQTARNMGWAEVIEALPRVESVAAALHAVQGA